MNLEEKFEQTIKEHRMIKKGESVWLACSGGPDSVVLFHLLYALKQKIGFKLGLLHFNHKLRKKSSDADEAFVKSLAKKYRVPCLTSSVRVSQRAKKDRYSLEEAARHARYEFFCKSAKKRKVKKIMTAHCQDDQAETILMRVLQGTGARGLSGIRRKMTMQGISFIRPLLEIQKEELLSYAKQSKIRFRKDQSNESTRFVRNWLRLELIPKLRDRLNPKVIEALARVPAIMEEENLLLEEIEKAAWKRVYGRKVKKRLRLKREEFLSCQPVLQFRLLNRALRTLDKKSGLSFDAWQGLRGQLAGKTYRRSLPRDIDFELTPLNIDIYKKF